MRHIEDQLADVDLGVQLLADLAGQSRVMRFSLVDLAAGKFPQAGEVNALLPSRDEKRAALFDHRSDNDDHDLDNRGNDVQERVIGQASHFGFRAVQMVAPKSISA